MNIIRQLSDRSNYGSARSSSQIKYIIIHYTGNDGDRATNNAKYFQTANRNASAHYFVDSTSIYQSVSDLFTSWSVGGSKYSDCNQTGGGSLFGIASNSNSLNIEMCDDLKDGKIKATDKTVANTIELIKFLMKKYNIDINHIIRHFDVNGKKCPAYYVDAKEWKAFKDLISSEDKTSSVKIEEEKEEETPVGLYKVTAKAGLNVREGEGTNFKKVCSLAYGDSFKVDKISRGWAHGKDSANRIGFVSLKWIKKEN